VVEQVRLELFWFYLFSWSSLVAHFIFEVEYKISYEKQFWRLRTSRLFLVLYK
jgi:hypothetical protein